jgi:hypothetical protein
VIVSEDTTSDSSSLDRGKVLGAHAIVDALWFRSSSARHAGFEIDDAGIEQAVLQFSQSVTPWIEDIDGPR